VKSGKRGLSPIPRPADASLKADLLAREGNMRWFTRKPRKETHHCVGWTNGDPEAGVFRNVALPGSVVMRLLDKGVHRAALESAGQKLRELGRRSGKKEPAL
jgi:hypothetical protein